MAAAAMTFTAVPLTLYPDMFPGPLGLPGERRCGIGFVRPYRYASPLSNA